MAAPFRAHVRALCEATGLPPWVLAAGAGVSVPTIRTLLVGRGGRLRPRLSARDAALLLDLTPARLAKAQHQVLAPREAVELARRLTAAGLTPGQIARGAGCDETVVERLAAGRSFGVTEIVLWRLRGLAEAMWVDEAPISVAA